MKKVMLGIDIGGTNSVIGAVDNMGNIPATCTVSTVAYPEVNDYIEALHSSIQRMFDTLDDVELKAIGIGAPDANYFKGAIENAPNLPWKGIVPICDLLKKYYDIPVVLSNDADAAAMGEKIYGGAKGMKDFIMITLGTGFGSGIVINGELVYGHTGHGGEIGETIVVPEGRDSACGRQGVLESYVSATGICNTFIELLGKRFDSSRLASAKHEEITSKMIAEEAEKGDRIALEAFDITGKWLALSIANAVAFCSPEAVFLFGGLAKAGELLFKPTERYLDRYVWDVYKGTFKLIMSELPENNAAVLGASALAWNEIDKTE